MANDVESYFTANYVRREIMRPPSLDERKHSIIGAIDSAARSGKRRVPLYDLGGNSDRAVELSEWLKSRGFRVIRGRFDGCVEW